MQLLNNTHQLPVFSLEADNIARNKHFRVYNLEGCLPSLSDLLIPHRKDYYLLAFVRHTGGRQWIDMEPYTLKDNTIYLTVPNQIIIKEGTEKIWSTGIAFTTEFLTLQENASISKLPIIQNSQANPELPLTATDIQFVEDIISKINAEYVQPGEWQPRMLMAYLTILLTYLSRIHAEQFKDTAVSAEKQLLKNFQNEINKNFRELHEVADYASFLHLSAKHLSESVKLQSGKPAIKHIHERLVLEARRLLFHTNHSLKEIAFDLGFSDDSYFNRFFKRETGVTPVEYRTTIRKMYH
jgi:AraC family transcriptional regulator, transcriptional activator of pobA